MELLELLEWLPFFAIFVALPLLGLFWLVRDATARLGGGQAFSWSVLYIIGCFFALIGQWFVLFLWLLTRPAKLATLSHDIDVLLPSAPANFRHAWLGTAIAVDPHARKVAMISRGVSKVYSFDDVRRYRWSIQRGGYVPGGGFEAAMANRRNNGEKRRNTGMFLEMRDIDHPSWQILFHRESDLKRWFEILSQAFEGQLATVK